MTYVTTRLVGLLEHCYVDRRIFATALRSVRPAMLLAGWRAQLRQRLSNAPPPAELAILFPNATHTQLLRWARRMRIHDARNRVLCRLVTFQGVESLYPLLRIRDNAGLGCLAASNSPAILVFGHIGASYGAAAGLGKMGVRTLLLSVGHKVITYPPSVEAWQVQTLEQPMLFLKRATDFLNRGGCVLMALDGREGGSFTELDLLGQTACFPRGIQTLHKLTGVPVIPVSARWTPGGKIDFATFTPVAGGGQAGTDAGMLQRAVRWLQEEIERDPGQLRSQYIAKFVRSSQPAGGAIIPEKPGQPGQQD